MPHPNSSWPWRPCGDVRGRPPFTLAALLVFWSVTVSIPFTAMAQPTSESEQIRKELRDLKQSYQQQLEKLEERLRKLEASTTNVSAPPSAFGRRPASPPVAASAESTNTA